MKSKNIPADIRTKSIKEAQNEIKGIIAKLENTETDLESSIEQYNRMMHLNFHIQELFKKKANEIKQYTLDKNGGEHNLHGGLAGFHKKVWAASVQETTDSVAVTFTLTSPDGEGGFPGTVNVEACYSLDQNNELSLVITANTDKETPLSFTQHAYFTLSNDPQVGNTLLHIDADK